LPPQPSAATLPKDSTSEWYINGEQVTSPEWQAQKECLFTEKGQVAFDLFAPKTALLLQNDVICSLVANKFPLIIVDEAQDTSEDQWSCVKSLATHSPLLCLADLDQQIYDFIPGVSSERVTQITASLSPLVVDFGSQNNRSSAAEIVHFGNDILNNTPRGTSYSGVSRVNFARNAEKRDKWIRQSVGIIRQAVQERTGHAPQSIAFLASWGKGVTTISRALKGTDTSTEIIHQVHFDETGALLASRTIAFCLEPKQAEHHNENIAHLLDLLAMFFRSKATQGSLALAGKLNAYAADVRQGTIRSVKAVKSSKAIISTLEAHLFTGDPKRDWLFVRQLFGFADSPDLRQIASAAEYLMVFNRGKRIVSGLVELWQTQNDYAQARLALDSALAEDQLLSGTADLQGINVMTLHKSKGKEFDCVIIINEENISPLAKRGEVAPHLTSRRLLRVGITRARHHVLLLMGAFPACPLLEGHNL